MEEMSGKKSLVEIGCWVYVGGHVFSRAKTKQVSSSLPLSPLLILLPFLVCFSAATEASFRPGFLYTRNRGRCTPQFWSSRREAWPMMVPEGSTVSKVFGSRAFERYRYDLTLLEATTRNDDVENVFASLVKESSAALLNSYARKGFPYSAWEVKTLLIQALVSEKAAAIQSQRFSLANQACD
ncbi:uncharacterized protein LOC114299215 [Camellia sinensis]|uniref:uncharacterized protein LOC114299215 n=1 Tax=Camellia sinensis TaxID=4442 RepID=UPI0010361451|nr:uncharacterized protein LOC114299215 [Camellia sinensis]